MCSMFFVHPHEPHTVSRRSEASCAILATPDRARILVPFTCVSFVHACPVCPVLSCVAHLVLACLLCSLLSFLPKTFENELRKSFLTWSNS